MPPRPPLAYRADIDGLRAVAVLAVVVYHLLPAAAPGGYVGVDVFFVVSGYLITGLTVRRVEAGAFSLVDFYARRVRRLLPALLLVVGASLAAASRLYSGRELADLGAASATSALFAANLHFYQALDYFTAPIETQPLLHLWSLGVEEQFYLLAPVGILALAARPRRLLGATALLTAASLVASVALLDRDPQAAFYLPHARAWELGLGALLALAPLRPLRGRTAALASTAGLALIALAVGRFDHDTPFPGLAALLPALGAALVLAAGPGAGPNRALSWEPLRRVGLWSYAWYLWHWPALCFATFVQMRPLEPLEALGVGAASLAVAAASTHLVEQPLRRGRPDLPPGRVVALGLGALLALATVGASVWAAHRPLDPPARPAATLAQLLADPDTDCGPYSGATPKLQVCAMGDTGGPLDLIVWGDSHASVWVGPLQDQVEAAGLAGLVITKNSCPPLLGLDRADLPEALQCGAHNAAVLDLVRTLRPRRVALAGRWTLPVTGARYGDTWGPAPRFVQAGSRDRPADVPLALEQTVARLRDLGAEVVLVGSVPEVAYDVRSVYSRAERMGVAPPPGPTRAAHEARTGGVRALLEAVARAPGVRTLPLDDRLCDATACAVERGGALLYSDDNHLSEAGAEHIAPALAPLLDGL